MAVIDSGKTYIIYNSDPISTVNGICLWLAPDGKTSSGWYDYGRTPNMEWTMVHDLQSGGWLIKNTTNNRYLARDPDEFDPVGSRLVCVKDPFPWDIWPEQGSNDTFGIFLHNAPQPMKVELIEGGIQWGVINLNYETGAAKQKWTFEPVKHRL